VEPRLGLIVGLLALLVIVAFLLLAIQARRLGRLRRRLDLATSGEEGRSIEGTLDAYLDKTLRVARAVEGLESRTAVLEASGRRAIQRIGLVRYNPFEGTGGNQSFALALLDAQDDGFVISSLHARAATRIYAKALLGGRAEGALSEEEAEAVRLARTATMGHPLTVDRDRAGVARGGA
jgi:HAMP domain-containing protein